ncbi:histidine kinase [Actibacterium mucosum KCTC 23349]|uniref:histidine kinase n=1 Tax=Actibacterium mucosum KCTC 23349 TaxID=1454373 RepID=A0A037ZRD5_9RHOB|nr:PAS-domain containing protein [Actibacterium mucosum]KAJ57392.1 histidine kinase [Actibacterium mucosum KCTC 23349]
MSLESKLAEERRARLAAEKLLEQKSRELVEANRKLAVHARNLTDEIEETRQKAEELRGENSKVLSKLEDVSSAFAIAEQRLWDSLETIPDGFAVFDSNSRLAAANRAYLHFFEGLHAATLGASYRDLVAIAADEGLIDPEGQSPEQWKAEMLARWEMEEIPNKNVRMWNGSYLKLIDRRTPNGDVVSLNLDITEMMRMWAAIEAVPDGFVLYDRDDRLVMCNERYREIYATSAAAMTPGTTFEEILRYGAERGQYRDAVGRVEEWLVERLANHRRTDVPVEQALSDGRWLRILEKETPDGGRVGLRVDITAQKEQQVALEEARVVAESGNRAKTAFFANMSHELRTPMNGVIGMAELLCDTELSEEQALYAETIRNSGESLLALLNDVLDFSKMEVGKLSLQSEPFDLEQTIHEVVMLLQTTASHKELDLVVDYDLFQPTMFEGDRGRVRQILTNLIGNAVKFTEQGHVLVRVVGFEAEREDYQRLHITVEDTGIGIAQEMQSHIFGEFNQVEDQQNRKFEGTGLGLAISKQLVNLMGGEMWLESEIGRGSCFGFHIELPIVEKPDLANLASFSAPGPVLIVDDQEVNRTILDRQLTQLGLETVLHRSATDALGARDVDPTPALIVSDDNMPSVKGADYAKALRKSGDDTPFLLLSSTPGAQKGADVDLVLSKPVLRRSLQDALTHLISNTEHDTEPEESGPRRMRILTAEDNRTNRLVFAKMVGKLNVDLTFAENGVKAVEAFRAQRPDLVFMDISMPEMDGKEATATIRQIEAETDAAPVPIVALTAHALSGDREEILKHGLDEYLTKPLKKDILHTVIRDHCPPDICSPFNVDEGAVA